jgi:plastocyanin
MTEARSALAPRPDVRLSSLDQHSTPANRHQEASLSGRLKALAILVGALLLSLPVVAGCGSSKKNSNSASTTSTTSTAATTTNPAGASGAAHVLTLTADPSGALKFDKTRLSTTSGKVTIKMDNPSTLQHGISILGNGVSQTGATVGTRGVSTITTTLPAGRYDFFCPVDGHKQAGMSGRLIVK